MLAFSIMLLKNLLCVLFPTGKINLLISSSSKAQEYAWLGDDPAGHRH